MIGGVLPALDPRPGFARAVEKFRDGPVQVSIWQNQGSKGAFRAASFELRYKDSQEQWQTGRSYTSSALLHLESAAFVPCCWRIGYPRAVLCERQIAAW
jgi:hypothetical protein